MKKIIFTDESVKGQITDSISENLTDSDLESKCFIHNSLNKQNFTLRGFQTNYLKVKLN